MEFKVVLYQTDDGYTVFCPGLQGCMTEGDSLEDALSNAQIAIREYMEASWIEMKEEIERDSQDSHIIDIKINEVEVELDGVEEAVAEEVPSYT